MRMSPEEWKQHKRELLWVNFRGYTRDLHYLILGDSKVPTTFPERLRKVINSRRVT